MRPSAIQQALNSFNGARKDPTVNGTQGSVQPGNFNQTGAQAAGIINGTANPNITQGNFRAGPNVAVNAAISARNPMGNPFTLGQGSGPNVNQVPSLMANGQKMQGSIVRPNQFFNMALTNPNTNFFSQAGNLLQRGLFNTGPTAPGLNVAPGINAGVTQNGFMQPSVVSQQPQQSHPLMAPMQMVLQLAQRLGIGGGGNQGTGLPGAVTQGISPQGQDFFRKLLAGAAKPPIVRA